MSFDNMRFSAEHEWVRLDNGGDSVTIGISEFAATELGDIVFVELPEVGSEFSAGDSMGTIEAVKTVADLYAPVGGTIEAVNEELENSPDLVNSSPYEQGWFVKVKLSNPAELDGLMSHEDYQKSIAEE